MKKSQILQLGIILVGLFIGVHFSKRNIALHEKEAHGYSAIHKSMDHGLLDVSQDSIVPQIEDLVLTKDPMSGWNLFIQTSNFRFTPENVNQAHQVGEGHAHLYINGQKFARIYGPFFHLPDLAGDQNEIKVTLNAKGHENLAIKETPIEKSVVVD